MKRICNTGIRSLGRNFRITRSGAVLLISNFGREEVVWWPPMEISKEIMETWRDYVYFIADDGSLMGQYDPPEWYMDVW
jgi:hypothetical protein